MAIFTAIHSMLSRLVVEVEEPFWLNNVLLIIEKVRVIFTGNNYKLIVIQIYVSFIIIKLRHPYA